MWDLAGQPEYRLIHQLFLDDLDAALLLFDCSDPADPFRGVRYWAKVLRKHAPSYALKLLVSARCDVSPPTVDDLAINRILSECSLHKHCCTSAATGEGIDGLVSSLIHSLPWERLIRITTPRAFQHTREFILKAKEVGTILISADEIKEGVERLSLDEGISKEQIATVISLLQASGLIYQLTSEAVETLVLLRPEKINQYASSIITAARNHPSGIGAVSERDVLVGKIPFIGFERLSTAEERIVLGACRRNSTGNYFMLISPHYGKDVQIL